MYSGTVKQPNDGTLVPDVATSTALASVVTVVAPSVVAWVIGRAGLATVEIVEEVKESVEMLVRQATDKGWDLNRLCPSPEESTRSLRISSS